MRIVRLGDCCRFLNGGTPSKAVERYYKGNIPLITGADITGPLVTNARSFITSEAIKNSATNKVPPGTILLVTRTSVGKVALAGMELCFTQDITAVFPDESLLNSRFLSHYLRSQHNYFKRLSRGATIKGVTRRIVESLKIPLPPLDEQRRIAAILDRVEAIRAKRQQTIEKLDSLMESIFLEMFWGTATKGWPKVEVSSLIAKKPNAIRTGPFGSQLLHSEFVESGIPVLGIDNVVNNEFSWEQEHYITDNKYQELKRYTVYSDDVLITIMGTCGRCAIVPKDIPTAISTKHLCCVTLDTDQCIPEYFQATFLMHPEVLHQLGINARGAVMPGLNMGIIKKLKIPLPPLSLQQEYRRRSAEVQYLKSAYNRSLSHLNELFASLQQRAFRGELTDESLLVS